MKNKLLTSYFGINSSSLSLIMLFIFLNIFSSCKYYIVKTNYTSEAEITKLKTNLKYIIVHQNSNTWHLIDLDINVEKKEIIANTEEVSDNHKFYLKTRKIGNNFYKLTNGDPTTEVHIYILEYIEGLDGTMIIPMSSINKIEFYNRDRGTQGGLDTLLILGIAASIFGLWVYAIYFSGVE
ncbi:MAG TPA: hypothetical protein VK590_08300 [Saprospiraceae bacterium]|nr:hypothetical protein [Saprospiraceae bacterium]